MKLRMYAIALKALAAAAVCGIVYWSVTQSITFGRHTAAVDALTSRNAILEKAPPAGMTGLPGDGAFRAAGETETLRLLADPSTGHFQVVDKRSGIVYRSYPDPEQLTQDTTGGLWAKHLISPVMYTYVQLNMRRDQVRESNWIEDQGAVKQFEWLENGFRLVYDIPKRGFEIPVRVTASGDFVEVAVEDRLLAEEKVDASGVLGGERLQELAAGGTIRLADLEGREAEAMDNAVRGISSLVGLRLYPFLGAVRSAGQEGYLLIPDGPGALVHFRTDRGNLKAYYHEKVYGDDLAFGPEPTSARQHAALPAFGIKSGRGAFLAHIVSGEEYASVLASPSGSFSGFNWAAAEHRYRASYFQPTSTDRAEGFSTYTRERFGADRAVRYYFLDEPSADYVGMAARYRQALIEEAGASAGGSGALAGTAAKGAAPAGAGASSAQAGIPLSVSLLGGAPEPGFLGDSYAAATTTEQAKGIVDGLLAAGVRNLSVTYLAWHQGGEGVYGDALPVAGGLGGNDGMRSFIEYAGERGVPVYLDAAVYARNNAGERGFNRRRDGLRDVSGSIVSAAGAAGTYTPVGNSYLERAVLDDLAELRRLGAAGLVFRRGVDRYLNSDFQRSEPLDRSAAKRMHEAVMAASREALGGAKVVQGNEYALKYADLVEGVPLQHSFDVFVDEQVPFLPMALHGVVEYAGDFYNLSADAGTMLLRSLEYGALPSFVLSHAASREFLKAEGLKPYFSSRYEDWIGSIGAIYAAFDEALGDVREAFIVDHREIAEGVKATTYSNGKRVVVNYNEYPVTVDGALHVEARGYATDGGGGAR